MTNGINVSRRLTATAGGATLGEEYRSSLRSGAPATLYRAVVLEVIFDPGSITAENKQKLKDNVQNPEFVETMPQNSVLAKIVAESHNNLSLAPVVVYPFFPPHLQMPIEAGEHIFIIYEDQAFQGSSLGRWMCRVQENYTVDDLNYTHADRRFDPTLNPELDRLSEERRRQQDNNSATPKNTKPGFPNGTGASGAYTLEQGDKGPNPYEAIFDSKTTKQGTLEAVPRFVKRPQDFVVQGKNNTIIVLGQDRTGKAERPERASDSKDKKSRAGAIDIIAGRGRIPALPTDNSPGNTEDKKTSALVVENTRGLLETDKNPSQRNRSPNPTEGDPSFEHDAARVLVTMNSVVDESFGLKHGTKLSYPDDTLKPTQPTAPSEDVGCSYVLGKADHVRLIARKKTTGPVIKGTVLIVKEGTKDEDLAYLYVDENGNIQLEGKKIYLGKAVKTSESQQQPYIKYQEYKATIEHLQAQIDSLTNFITNTLGNTVSQGLKGSVAIPMLPVAGAVAAGVALQTAAQVLGLTMEASKGETPTKITACKSTKVFGE